MQRQNALNNQQRPGRNVFAPSANPQVLGKVIDRSLNGMPRPVLSDVTFQQLHVNRIRRVVVLLRSLLQRKMVHLDGIDLHGDNVPVQTRSHPLGDRRLTAARRPAQSDDEYLSRNGSTHDVLRSPQQTQYLTKNTLTLSGSSAVLRNHGTLPAVRPTCRKVKISLI